MCLWQNYHERLSAKEIEQALYALAQTKTHPSGEWWYRGDLSIQVATAAEATHPHAAIQLYQQAAEQCIGMRGRSAYYQACQYLLHVWRLYERQGEATAWRQYITRLQEQNKSLRALKEEMTHAKLV